MTDMSLAALGWTASFSSQVDTPSSLSPARVTEVKRDHLSLLTTQGPTTAITPDETGHYAVGDWVLVDGAKVAHRLERTTEIARRGAGPQAGRQLIAANVDTLAIVSSCNADFNVARLERYLAMASSAGCLPLIVLTKADTCDAPEDFARQAEALSPLVTAITLNAKTEASKLEPWCKNGQTLALVGSSGVGKTTLQNALTGVTDITQDIREDDAKGRHTTTARALRPTLAGGWLIDTPGMRELALSDASEGIDAVFSDITDLIPSCKFNDCAHQSEPGCAVQAAIADGTLDPDRLERWRKLLREDEINSQSIAQAHARSRSLQKMYNEGKKRSKHKRKQS